MASRLILVSNRLPVVTRLTETGPVLCPSDGGLASGLRPWHQCTGGLWIGWPGDLSRYTPGERSTIETQLTADGLVPVSLSRDQVDRYYHGFCNRVLWPLFHYLIDRVPVEPSGWDAYRDVNQTFADVVAAEYRDGDTIWVHDYQLLLLPALLRHRLPRARIGFFLHIPFPSSEIFRILPWRHEVLQGLLGADLLGFHTFAYMRHFVTSLLHVDGVEADIDSVRTGDREVRLGVFPMGIDAARFAELAAAPDVVAHAAAIRREAGGRQIVLGVDRLDYTKGIPRRLQAVERLLTREPGLRDRVRYMQIAVPSRGEVDAYRRFRRQVEETVGRINGACGTLHSAPVHYMHRHVSERELVALYCAADVMLVTPLRDGMNLVAKEFVASRIDGDGVLVLSEFAGAAAELDGAQVVNPYDVDGVAARIGDALSMAPAERAARMQRLRQRVTQHDVHAWAAAFLHRLGDVETAPAVPPGADFPSPVRDVVTSGARWSLLLDYDGTLVPLAPSPDLAIPDPELLSLLGTLSALPDVNLQIVSGRPRQPLERWFGQLPITLWAEHGFWWRDRASGQWVAADLVAPDWMARVRPILQQFTESTPGASVEEKSASVAWHFRNADPEFGARQAHELRLLLGDALSNQPFEVLEGRKVIEIRLRGISKGVVAQRAAAAGESVIAIGDDRTNEDLFLSLAPSAITIAVGRHVSRARYRVDDYRGVRQLLGWMAALARRGLTQESPLQPAVPAERRVRGAAETERGQNTVLTG
jgi:trehalose 6-phosphate synthase/phosphatase